MRRFKIIFTLLLVGLASYVGTRSPEFWGVEEETELIDRAEEAQSEPVSPPQEQAAEEPDERFTRNSDGTVYWNPSIQKSRELHQGSVPERDLDLIDQLFSAYRLVYKENPVGTENFEFITPLLGDNPKKVIFIPLDHPDVKDNTLHDRWGIPYHFHPLSGVKLEIRSAGSDQKLWTEDDLVWPMGQRVPGE